MAWTSIGMTSEIQFSSLLSTLGCFCTVIFNKMAKALHQDLPHDMIQRRSGNISILKKSILPDDFSVYVYIRGYDKIRAIIGHWHHMCNDVENKQHDRH